MYSYSQKLFALHRDLFLSLISPFSSLHIPPHHAFSSPSCSSCNGNSSKCSKLKRPRCRGFLQQQVRSQTWNSWSWKFECKSVKAGKWDWEVIVWGHRQSKNRKVFKVEKSIWIAEICQPYLPPFPTFQTDTGSWRLYYGSWWLYCCWSRLYKQGMHPKNYLLNQYQWSVSP